MGMLEIIITSLSVLIIASWVLLYNLLKRFEDAEDTILELEEILVMNKNIIQSTVDNMRVIDSKGGFESEDEVGSVFKALLKEIENLEQR
tara:strand:+ start:328 stop:597 length:270 start_codon:yes stop_codon:yes gene_type:complete